MAKWPSTLASSEASGLGRGARSRRSKSLWRRAEPSALKAYCPRLVCSRAGRTGVCGHGQPTSRHRDTQAASRGDCWSQNSGFLCQPRLLLSEAQVGRGQSKGLLTVPQNPSAHGRRARRLQGMATPSPGRGSEQGLKHPRDRFRNPNRQGLVMDGMGCQGAGAVQGDSQGQQHWVGQGAATETGS